MSETRGPAASAASLIGDLEDLFENAPCGYLTLDTSGRICKVNATLTAWTGFTSDQLLGKRLHEFLNIAGRIYLETHITPLLRMQGFFNEFALDVVTAAGERLPMIANAVERRDADGNPLFTRLVMIKATDRRRYERELLDGKAAAQAGLRAERETSELREQFIAVLGHDLRNPLASIASGARILERELDKKNTRQIRVLDMIQSTVMRMSGLIDNVLDFARGRLGGGLTLDRDANRPLEPVLRQVVDELRAVAPDRSIESDFHLDRPVNCDRSRIGQLVSNLLGNAMTHGAADAPVRICAVTRANTFELWVSNAGAAIPEAARERLFQPFFRGEVRASQAGLGLGLYIASEIAKAHGGTLSVSSTDEETRFTFEMPN